MPTVASLEREARAVLARAGVKEPALDALTLLAHVLALDRVRLHLDPARPVGPRDTGRFRDLLARRARREPLQYLTGAQEFWSLAFRVSPAVLIPRPETELLVAAFVRLNDRPDPVVLDVGTGSGCVAIAAAREVPGARVFAGDLSEAALAVARDNAGRHGVAGRIEFRRGDLFAAFHGLGLEGRADFVLSNPPYVAEPDLPGLEPEVRDHEPRAALTAGADGLAVHRRIAAEAGRYLAPGGRLILEIGAGQQGAIRALYGAHRGLEIAGFEPDLAGVPRACIVRTAGEARSVVA